MIGLATGYNLINLLSSKALLFTDMLIVERQRNVERVVDISDDSEVTVKQPSTSIQSSPRHGQSPNRVRSFRYDHAFNSVDPSSQLHASQRRIYEKLGRPILDNAFRGLNNCIFAYGQTGSGKSYTMMGRNDPENEGIIPRIAVELFQRIKQREADNASVEHRVEVSYYELYNEKVRDLLNPKNAGKLRVREHPSLGPYVEDLSKLVVQDKESLLSLIREGNQTRTVAATAANELSSRSHAIVAVTLSQIDKANSSRPGKVSRIHLVDLAGSERSSDSQTSGKRLKEGSEINKSLSTLGRVITALVEKQRKRVVVPYRDSMLTWLLKESLGGNALTTMIATISPSRKHLEQTVLTLRFADFARQVTNHAVINEDSNVKLIRELRSELEELRARADANKSSSEYLQQVEASEKLLADMNQTWEERLRRTKEIQEEREKALEDLGIHIEHGYVGVRTPQKSPYLVNLNDDPLMSECLVYNIRRGETVVGSVGSSVAGIKLSGESILEHHCSFVNDGTNVILRDIQPGAEVAVNGSNCTTDVELRSGSLIALGSVHVFRFNNPLEESKLRTLQGSPLRNQITFSRSSTPVSLGHLPSLAPGLSPNTASSPNTDPRFPERLDTSAFASPQVPSKNLTPLFDSLSTRENGQPSFNKSIVESLARCWRSCSTFDTIQKILSLKGLVKEAQIMSRSLGCGLDFQVCILEGRVVDILAETKQDATVNSELDASGIGMESLNGMSQHNGETEIANNTDALDRTFEPVVCVRVVDDTTQSIHLWSVDHFTHKMDWAAANGFKASEVFSSRGLGRQESHRQVSSLLGVGYVPGRILQFGSHLKVDIYSPYSYTIMGVADLSLIDQKIELTDIRGISTEEAANVRPVLYLWGTDGTIRCLGTTDKDKARRIPRGLNEGDMLVILVVGLAKSLYIDKQKSWDEMQEVALEPLENDQFVASVTASLQVLELNEEAVYVPCDVHIDLEQIYETVLLHQGHQRRVRITLHSIPVVDVQGEPRVAIQNVRLVDPQGLDHAGAEEHDEMLTIVTKPTHNVSGLDSGSYSFEVQWDSAAHGSLFLNRVTKDRYSVLADVRVDVKTSHSSEYSTIIVPLRIQIKPRAYSIPMWRRLLQPNSYSDKVVRHYVFAFCHHVPKSTADYWVYDPSLRVTDDNGVLDSWRPRGVSLLKEFSDFKTRMRQGHDLIFNRLKLETVAELPPHAEPIPLERCIELWKKTAPKSRDLVSEFVQTDCRAH